MKILKFSAINDTIKKVRRQPIECKKTLASQALTSIDQLVEHHPARQRVASVIPSQGTCLGCRASPWLGCMQQAAD